MKLLVIGSGRTRACPRTGRAKPARAESLRRAGNGGAALENGVENISLRDIKELIEFSKKKKST
jgi:phosphoribosylamine-glycine ligase